VLRKARGLLVRLVLPEAAARRPSPLQSCYQFESPSNLSGCKKRQFVWLARSSRAEYVLRVRLYALVEAGDPEAIDVYLYEQDAQRALEDCLRDESEWRGLLRIEEIEPPRPPFVSLN
jgi:hypothetical protein